MKPIFLLLIRAGLVGLAITFYLAFSGRKMLTTVEASALPGLAALSGTVEATKPFQAAQVYIRNVDKRVLYMVYTSAGHYEAINLFPGNYEISVKTKGLESDVTKLVLKAGQKAAANLALREANASDAGPKDVEFQAFGEIYPPGPGLVVAGRTCLYCHGENFLPSKQMDREHWDAALDYMMGKGEKQYKRGAQIAPGMISPQDREVLLAYLVANFGPDSKKRAVKGGIEMPVDERAVSKAMYIEYYFPTDPPGAGINAPEYVREKGPFSSHRVGQDPHFDAQGNVWVADRGVPNRVVKLNPRTGEMKEWVMPDPKGGLHGLTVDKFGIVWLPETTGLHLNSFDPKSAKFTRYDLDPGHQLSPDIANEAQSIVTDSKQNLWVTVINGNRLAKWDREKKAISLFELPTNKFEAFPYGIVTDKNDNIWVAEFHGSKVAKLDPKAQKWTEFTPPTNPALIRRLSVDSKGTVWIALFSGGKIVKLDPASGKMAEYKLPHQPSNPYDIWPDAQDNLWISDAGQGGALIKFDPRAETFAYFPTPQRADGPKLEITREGAIWYCPRSSKDYPGVGVLYPNMEKITTLGANY